MKETRKICQDCAYCRPITEEGIVRSFGEPLKKKHLFDDYDQPMYKTCKYKEGWNYMWSDLHCDQFRSRRISAQDLRLWYEILPKRWKNYVQYFERLEIITDAERRPITLEIYLKCGTINRRWVFQTGEPRYLVTEAIDYISWLGYNHAMLHEPKMPSERSYWGINKCDKEIGGDGINPYAEQLRY